MNELKSDTFWNNESKKLIKDFALQRSCRL